MPRRAIASRQDLKELYLDVDLTDFAPTHKVKLFCNGTNRLLREDFVSLSDPDNKGVRYGQIPGDPEAYYAWVPPNKWQCLRQHGIVSAQAVKYLPDYVRPGEREGVVYFIQAGREGPIKIGWSSDLGTRVAQLQTANASKLHILFSFPGTFEDEFALHTKFSHLRLEAEWFQNSPEIWDYLKYKGK